MFYCTNVQFYPSIFNVSLNLCTSVQKYMYKILHLPLCTSVPNNVPVYEMHMCTSVQFCKHKDKCTSVH